MRSGLPFLTTLSTLVRWNSSYSNSFPAQQGVCQNAVHSLILYAVFTNELLYDLEHSHLHGSILTPFTAVLLQCSTRRE